MMIKKETKNAIIILALLIGLAFIIGRTAFGRETVTGICTTDGTDGLTKARTFCQSGYSIYKEVNSNCGGGYEYWVAEYTTVPSGLTKVESCVTSTPVCHDSDGSSAAYYTKGTITFTNDPGNSWSDVCLDDKNLRELYCTADGQYMEDTDKYCINGCVNGACVPDTPLPDPEPEPVINKCKLGVSNPKYYAVGYSECVRTLVGDDYEGYWKCGSDYHWQAWVCDEKQLCVSGACVSTTPTPTPGGTAICGDGVCNPLSESTATCPSDCPKKEGKDYCYYAGQLNLLGLEDECVGGSIVGAVLITVLYVVASRLSQPPKKRK